jgi:crotonobetainyl-CoA:carnitine CoA-transferase CaiB-like acyl-CoA transferase
MARGILSDIRVVELGEGIAVPYCGKLLADFGAQVVKIETPGVGDRTRQHGPFPADMPHPERSGLFLALNTNKFGVTLNPELATGRQLLGELLQQADILIHDLPSCHQEALRLLPDALHQEYPRLIITAITPYGQSGPYCTYQR